MKSVSLLTTASVYNCFAIFSLSLLTPSVPAQELAPPNLQQELDSAVPKILKDSGVPSASIAVVIHGQLAFTVAYGDARLVPAVPAEPRLRYGIGSISKQFIAASVLMLVEEGTLTLDDLVSKFLPDLTRAREVTLRELLSHTAGYRDDLPQSFVTKWMQKPVTPQYILDNWAKKPLDFDPGTRFEYSNTDYIILGLIIEKVSGMKLAGFLQKRIFTPLDMKTATCLSTQTPSNLDVEGYGQRALGSARVAPQQGPGWLFAAGELIMTAGDLAKWNISLMNQSLLTPASYKEMEQEGRLKNGICFPYGLGLRLSTRGTHRELYHAGDISGFYGEDTMFPDDKAAVVVLTNMDLPSAASAINRGIADILVGQPDPDREKAVSRARRVFEALRRGQIDRAQFTSDANDYFDPQTLADYAASLTPLGSILGFTASAPSMRAGMIFRNFTVRFKDRTLSINTSETENGKYGQFLVQPAE